MNIKNTLRGLNISIQKMLVLGMIFAFAGGAVAYAQFYRTTLPLLEFGYGYGYGYDNGDGYGYGYSFKSGVNNYSDYGFFGDDGSAVINSIDTTKTTLAVTYTTTYTATNSVEYGEGDYDASTDPELETADEYTVTITGLTCGTEYDVRVLSEDAGGNIWNNNATTKSTSACSSGGGGGSSGGSSSAINPILLSSDVPTLQNQLRGLLLHMVAILQAQLQSLGGDMNLSEILERTLRISMLGDDVLKLQQFLNSDPATQLAVVGAGSPGNETRYFGPLTDAAVKKFQEKHGLTVDGIVGPKTLAVIKALLGR